MTDLPPGASFSVVYVSYQGDPSEHLARAGNPSLAFDTAEAAHACADALAATPDEHGACPEMAVGITWPRMLTPDERRRVASYMRERHPDGVPEKPEKHREPAARPMAEK